MFPIKIIGDYASIFVKHYHTPGIDYRIDHDSPFMIIYVGSKDQMPEPNMDEDAAINGHPAICIPKEDINDYHRHLDRMIQDTIIQSLINTGQYCHGEIEYLYSIENGIPILETTITMIRGSVHIRMKYGLSLGKNMIIPLWDDIKYIEPI